VALGEVQVSQLPPVKLPSQGVIVIIIMIIIIMIINITIMIIIIIVIMRIMTIVIISLRKTQYIEKCGIT